MWTVRGSLRILDFDLENRPLSYLGDDWTSAEITAMAWCWIGSDEVETLLLLPDGSYINEKGHKFPANDAFATITLAIKAADIVTGHYIRKHDLPLLNGARVEAGLSSLPNILVQDTKCDLVKRKDLSASQENLASLFGLPEAKHHMTQTEWRTANRLTPEGIRNARKRVVDDVKQHMALREVLLKRKLLHPPHRWEP